MPTPRRRGDPPRSNSSTASQPSRSLRPLIRAASLVAAVASPTDGAARDGRRTSASHHTAPAGIHHRCPASSSALTSRSPLTAVRLARQPSATASRWRRATTVRLPPQRHSLTTARRRALDAAGLPAGCPAAGSRGSRSRCRSSRDAVTAACETVPSGVGRVGDTWWRQHPARWDASRTAPRDDGGMSFTSCFGAHIVRGPRGGIGVRGPRGGIGVRGPRGGIGV